MSSKRQPRELTDVIADVIHADRGLAKVIADALPASLAAVYRVADRHDADALKAYWIPTICRVTRSFAILDVLERAVGRVAFVLPRASTADHADIVHHSARAMTEVGEALARIAQSIADGTITPEERTLIEREIDDAHTALAAVRSVVAQKVAA